MISGESANGRPSAETTALNFAKAKGITGPMLPPWKPCASCPPSRLWMG